MVEQGFTPERLRNPEVPVTDSYYDAYYEGNLRFPVHGMGMSVLVADAALSDPSFDPATFVRMEWTPEQFEKTKTAMNRAHAARHIGVASPEHMAALKKKITAKHGPSSLSKRNTAVVKDKNIPTVWRSTKSVVMGMIASVADLQHAKFHWTSDTKVVAHAGRALTVVLRYQPEVRAQCRNIFHSFAETLRSPEGARLAERARSLFDYREDGPPTHDTSHKSSGELEAVAEELFHLMMKRLGEEGTTLPPRMESQLKNNLLNMMPETY